MSAPETAAKVDEVIQELGEIRFSLIQFREKVINNRKALERLQSANPLVNASVTILSQMNRDFGEEVSALLSAHQYLTEYRISVL